MKNSRVSSRAGRGSIFPWQFASLLKLREAARASRFGGLAQLFAGSNRFAGWCSRQRRTWLTVFSAGMVVLVGILDHAARHELSLAIFYVLPVMFATWFAGRCNGMIVVVMASMVELTVDVASRAVPPHLGVALWNVSARAVIFALVVLLLARIRALQSGLEENIAARTAQLEAQMARGRAMQREVAAASTREQQHIAHELHDGLGQELGALAFRGKLLAAELAQERAGLADEAESLVELLNQTMARSRALSHLLDPVGGESGGLRPALFRLIEESGRAFTVKTAFEAPETLPDLPPEMASHLHRIAQEALHNAVKHSQATSIWLHVGHEAGILTLSVANDGAGFQPHAAETSNAQGMGLRIMHYRAEALGARLQIKSAPGGGSQVLCTVPLNGPGRA